MNTKLPIPKPEAIIYEDQYLYVCLATHPITHGHIVVVWKQNVADLHKLKDGEYEYLMRVVNRIRNSMLELLKIKKVYLIYMDEVQHVHWHLVPRYNQKGFDVFLHEPSEKIDLSLASKFKQYLLAK